MHHNPGESGFRYHDYALLLAFIGDKDARRVGVQDLNLRQCFRDSSSRLLAEITERLQAAYGGDCAAEVASYLYSPITLRAFGVSDYVGMVLVDDFDSLFHISADLNTSVEQISLAFMPRVDSIAPTRTRQTPDEWLTTDQAPHLVDLAEVLRGSSADCEHDGALGIERETTPLTVISRIKVNALLSLGLGMRGQRALYRAIARRAHHCLELLREIRERRGHPDYLMGVPEAGDRESFWFSLLDTQGASDIGIIIGTQNYTVAMAILLGIQSLTMADVYREEPQLRDSVEEYGIHGALIELAQHSKEDRTLESNHALTSIYSTMCVAESAYQQVAAERNQSLAARDDSSAESVEQFLDLAERLYEAGKPPSEPGVFWRRALDWIRRAIPKLEGDERAQWETRAKEIEAELEAWEAEQDQELVESTGETETQGHGPEQDEAPGPQPPDAVSGPPGAPVPSRPVPNYPIYGQVILDTSMDVNPGHMPELEKDLLNGLWQYVKPQPSEIPPLTQPVVDPKSFHFVQAGRNDITFRNDALNLIGYLETESSSGEIPARYLRYMDTLSTLDFFWLNKEFNDSLNKRNGDSEHSAETGVLDVFSTLTIPVPRNPRQPRDRQICPMPEPHLPLLGALVAAKNRVYSNDDDARFAQHELEQCLKDLKAPSPLQFAISYLYQTYAKSISDPYLYDSVIDLDDVFQTLYQLLVRTLPAQRVNEGHWRRGLTKRDCEGLSRVVESINNALLHRIAMNGPKNETRDTAIDIRGGLNQIVHAIDVPVKVGLGLLRFFKASSRDKVCAVTRLRFNCDTVCHRLDFNDSSYCVARIDVNVSHMCDPIESLYYFHEVAHLMQDYVLDRPPLANRHHELAAARIERGEPHAFTFKQTMDERIEEVFAGQFTLLFLFGWDSDTFLRHYVASYSSSVFGAHATRRDELLSLAEALIRVFLVIDPMQTEAGLSQSQSDDSFTVLYAGSRKGSLQREFDLAMIRFDAMLKEYGPFFRNWTDVVASGGLDFMYEQFEEVFERSYAFAGETWSQARSSYEVFAEGRSPWRYGSDYDSRIRLADLCADQIEKGNIFVADYLREELSSRGFEFDREKDRCNRSPDELMLVCDLLHAYARLCYAGLSTTQMLHETDTPRDSAADNIGEPNCMLLSFGRPGVVAVRPADRRTHLLWRIVIHKKFWDISTDMRARRFKEVAGVADPPLGD